MATLHYEEIAAVLEQARRLDRNCELFGASKHQYRLEPPIDAAAVRAVEEQYGFALPEDYFRFITEIANGGAGPDYGVMSFDDSMMGSAYHDFREAYKHSLKNPFTPRRMKPEEVETSFAFGKTAYEKDPERFFVYENDEDALCPTDGFLVLGTHGCQWDFGLIVSGERKGQVFDTDNEGGYAFSADSFTAFYQRWLDWLSNPENIQRELDKWRKLSSGRKPCPTGAVLKK